MYTRQEASIIRKKFWTLFGQYMRPVKNAEGETVNWINYKTGVKNIFFKMNADNRQATVSIELRHSDTDLQRQLFERFQNLGSLLTEELKENWVWELFAIDENGQTISRIGKTLEGVSIFNEKDWPAIISFLKPRIIALDSFWMQVKDLFA
jgi:hypothetical protein